MKKLFFLSIAASVLSGCIFISPERGHARHRNDYTESGHRLSTPPGIAFARAAG